MASGKQLSFQYGEVSPSQYYRSDEAMYANALSKMSNFFVLHEGGSANRPGLINEGEHAFQANIPTVGGTPGIKGYWFRNPLDGSDKLIEYHARASGNYNAFYVDGVEKFLGTDGFDLNVTPEMIRFLALKEGVLMTPSLEVPGATALFFDANPIYDFNTGQINYFNGGAHSLISGVSGGYFGSAPYLPVSYYVTATYEDGSERFVTSFVSGTISSPTTAPSTIVMPHADLQSNLQITLNAAESGAKWYNFYRAPGRDGGFYKLAGRVKYDGVATSVKFNDYGVDDATQTPPLDGTLYGVDQNVLGHLGAANTAGYYQQRLLLSYDTQKATSLQPGDIGASKIGCSKQLIAPIVFNNTDAFQFTVPVTDNSPVVAQLGMERHIVFTEKNVWMLRGGTQGVLTPLTVNPGVISEQGCSRTVEPKMKGRRGYFLNFSHTQLFAIEFGLDGNAVVFSVSDLSEHLLEEDIVQMEVTGGKEDTVYLLRRDGKLIRITVTPDTAGFAPFETEGFIESMYVKRVKRDYFPYVAQDITDERKDPEYDALMLYVIRDGVRYLERLAYREDALPEGFIYADSCMTFGERLAIKPDGSYGRIQGQVIMMPATPADGCRINIQNGFDYAAGDPVLLAATAEIEWLMIAGNKLQMFYEDDDGVTRFCRFVSTGVGTAPGGLWTFGYNGYFETDLPAQLQDVETQNPSNKLALETRWLLCANFITVDDLAGKELSIFADDEVVSSPLNPNRPTITANTTPGDPTELPDYYCWGVFGLPYRSEMVTLDLEAQDNRTLSDSYKLFNAVGIAFNQSRGGFFGMENKPLEQMEEFNYLTDEDFNKSQPNTTGQEIINIPSEWTRPGRVAVIQVDPVPMTILAVYPKGVAGD